MSPSNNGLQRLVCFDVGRMHTHCQSILQIANNPTDSTQRTTRPHAQYSEDETSSCTVLRGRDVPTQYWGTRYPNTQYSEDDTLLTLRHAPCSEDDTSLNRVLRGQDVPHTVLRGHDIPRVQYSEYETSLHSTQEDKTSPTQYSADEMSPRTVLRGRARPHLQHSVGGD